MKYFTLISPTWQHCNNCYLLQLYSHCYNAHCHQSKSILTDSLLIASEFVIFYSNSNAAIAKPSFRIRLLWFSIIIMINLWYWLIHRNLPCNCQQPWVINTCCSCPLWCRRLQHSTCSKHYQNQTKRSPVESKSCSIAGYCRVKCSSMEWTKRSLDCLNT